MCDSVHALGRLIKMIRYDDYGTPHEFTLETPVTIKDFTDKNPSRAMFQLLNKINELVEYVDFLGQKVNELETGPLKGKTKGSR